MKQYTINRIILSALENLLVNDFLKTKRCSCACHDWRGQIFLQW